MVTRRARSFADFAASHVRIVFLIGAFAILAGSWPNDSVQAAETTPQYLRSGLITVNGDGYIVRFSAVNASDIDQELTLALRDANGKTVKVTTGIVGPDKSLTLSYDPLSDTRVRAEIVDSGNGGIQDDSVLPTLELSTKGSAGVKPVLVLDEFWHMDAPAI